MMYEIGHESGFSGIEQFVDSIHREQLMHLLSLDGLYRNAPELGMQVTARQEYEIRCRALGTGYLPLEEWRSFHSQWMNLVSMTLNQPNMHSRRRGI